MNTATPPPRQTARERKAIIDRVSAAAWSLDDEGFTVLPIRPGKKSPDLAEWKQYIDRRPTREEMESWFGQNAGGASKGIKAQGFGVVTGKVWQPGSRDELRNQFLVMFEGDTPDSLERLREAAERVGLLDLVDRIIAAFLERTPGGGFHTAVFCSKLLPNTPLAYRPAKDKNGRDTWKAKYETRGYGGQFVAAPSGGNTHESGRDYVLVNGSLAGAVTLTEEEVDLLFHLAQSFDERPKSQDDAYGGSEHKTAGPSGGTATGRPGDDYNVRGDWRSVMRSEGWKLVNNVGGEEHWVRPGKDLREGISATFNHGGSGLFWCFSTSALPIEVNRSYRPFGLYTAILHGGDFRASAKALRQLGYGEKQPGPKPSSKGAERNGTGHHESNGHAGGNGKPPGDAPTSAPSEKRPEIFVSPEIHATIDQAIDALRHETNIYQRGNTLVTVVRDAPVKKKKRGILRQPGSPSVIPVEHSRLRDMLSRLARWMKHHRTRNGDWVDVPVTPCEKSVEGVITRRAWPTVRPIGGVVECPTIRPDGSILDTPGWDEETALLYEPNADFAKVPEKPSLNDAQMAAFRLLEIVVDFPFVNDSHRAAWLAALLTPMARYSIDGPCPLFLFDANTAGSGKGKLCDTIARITTGRDMTKEIYPDKEEEMHKVISAIALAAEPMVMFDNLETGTQIGGKAIDMALTVTFYKGRLLGQTKRTPDLPMTTVFYASGNNVGQKGDASRRVIPCRLRSKLENPEDRSDFKIKGDLLSYVSAGRKDFVRDALTILRAHAIAGRPSCGLTPIGSYEAWSEVVRNAVFWATGYDPAETRKEARQSDVETQWKTAFVAGFREYSLIHPGFTAAEAIRDLERLEKAQDETTYATLRNALMDISPKGGLPSSRAIGKHLSKLKDSVIGGLVIRQVPTKTAGICRWKVVEAKDIDTDIESDGKG